MKSYLKFLSRNKLYSVIEAVGLAVSLAFVIIIGCYTFQQYGIAYEHKDGDCIYIAGMPDYPGLTYGFNDHISEWLPEVEMSARYCGGYSTVATIGNEKYNLTYAAVERNFFEIFPKYELATGDLSAIDGKYNVFVSQTFASRLSVDDPVGTTIRMGGVDYTVAGMLKDFNKSIIPYADLIVNCESPANSEAYEYRYDRYGCTIPFMKVRKGTDREQFTTRVEALCKEIYPEFYGKTIFERVTITRVDEIFFANLQQFNGGDKGRLMLFVAIGILLLLSAIFNYINLSFALTGLRAKEMATRRLVGASKGEVFGKYILESLSFTAICMLFAVLIAIAVEPLMNSLMSTTFPLKVLLTPSYILCFVLHTIGVGVICGFVPALAACRNEPIDVVRGVHRVQSKRVFSKIFIVLQGTLAVFMISMAIVMESQYRKSLSRPMHSNIDNIVFMRDGGRASVSQYTTLKDRLLALPSVKRVGFAQAVPGTLPGGQFSKTVSGDEILYRTFRMDSTAFNMLAFEKLEDYGVPLRNGVWFGQKAFRATGFTSENHEITELRRRTRHLDQTAGIIADFPINSENMGAEDYIVVVVNRLEDMYFTGFLVETDCEDAEILKAIRAEYDKWSLENNGVVKELYCCDFIRGIFRDGLAESRKQMNLMVIFMMIAVMISLLGMLAMSTYYSSIRSRDIAVRKVFGGTVTSETTSAVISYMKMVLVSCIIGVPAAVWASGVYLRDYIFKIENYWWIFLVAVTISLLGSFISVFWQTLSAARTNPAAELKKE